MSSFRGFKRFPFLTVFIVAAMIAAAVLFLERVDHPVDRDAVREGRKTAPREKGPRRETSGPKRSESEFMGQRIAIVIDDIGFDLRLVEELARIRAPIAFAVLPHTPHAAEAAELLHAAGKEILLHLPMEPLSYPAENPGEGALLVDMDDGRIRRLIEADLDEVPYVSGVNNHMGSRFMEDDAKLSVVMEELSKRGLFFVDSRTSADSRGREAAAAAGVRFGTRTLFIDHAPGYAAALSNLVHSPRQKREGQEPLLMIGHPHPDTIRALREAQSLWQEEGVRVIPVSAYISMSDGNAGYSRKLR
jgi:uncharacterized protein